MQGMRSALTEEIRTLAQKVDRNDERSEKRHVLVMTALQNMDGRLDDLEVVVPKLKKRVGMR